MGRKETEEAIADNRADRVKRVGSATDLLVELKAGDVLAEAEAAGEYPLTPAEREWVDAPAVGRELLAEDLQNAEAVHACHGADSLVSCWINSGRMACDRNSGQLRDGI